MFISLQRNGDVMKVDIYKIYHKKWKYLIVPQDTNVKDLVGTLEGFRGCSVVPSFIIIQRGHDTYGTSSALNSDEFRSKLSNDGFAYSHRIMK